MPMVLPWIAEGYGSMGDIPFEIVVADDLSLTASVSSTVVASIDGVTITYTTDFFCVGQVFEDGSAECTARDGVATVELMGQIHSFPQVMTGTGQITGTMFEFAMVGPYSSTTGQASRIGP